MLRSELKYKSGLTEMDNDGRVRRGGHCRTGQWWTVMGNWLSL